MPIGLPRCIADGRALASCGAPPLPLPWSCCRTPTTDVPLTPAPERTPGVYPHPPATRPAAGKANVVLILTDDQDKLLGSLEVPP